MQPARNLSLDTIALAVSLQAAVIWGIKVREPPGVIRFTAKVLSVSLLSITVLLRGGPPLLATALAFGSLGDAFLASGSGGKPFLGALLSFLVEHVLYILFFGQHGGGGAFVLASTTRSIGAVAIIIIGATMATILYSRVGLGLRLPVFIYIAALGTMAIKALDTPSNLVAAGGFTFGVSDTILSVNRFVVAPTSPHRVWMEHLIAVLYYSSQAMITLGALNALV